MIDPLADMPVLVLIGLLFTLAFFAAISPMDRY